MKYIHVCTSPIIDLCEKYCTEILPALNNVNIEETKEQVNNFVALYTKAIGSLSSVKYAQSFIFQEPTVLSVLCAVVEDNMEDIFTQVQNTLPEIRNLKGFPSCGVHFVYTSVHLCPEKISHILLEDVDNEDVFLVNEKNLYQFVNSITYVLLREDTHKLCEMFYYAVSKYTDNSNEDAFSIQHISIGGEEYIKAYFTNEQLKDILNEANVFLSRSVVKHLRTKEE